MNKRKFPVLAVGVILMTGSIIFIGGCEKKETSPPPPTESTPSPTPAPATAPASSMPQPASAPGGTSPMSQSDPSSTSTMADANVEAAMRKSDCFTCHAVDKKLIGPAYQWVAFRYKDDKDALSKLTASVKNGSTGKWTAYTGGVAMTPHPQLSDDQIKAMVQWVLSQKPVEPPKS